MNSASPAILIIFLFIMAGFGLIGVFLPHLAWRMSEGWKFKEPVEPSDLWILGSRISGVIVVLLCLFLAGKACNSGPERSLAREIRLQVEGQSVDQNLRIYGNQIPNRADSPAP